MSSFQPVSIIVHTANKQTNKKPYEISTAKQY